MQPFHPIDTKRKRSMKRGVSKLLNANFSLFRFQNENVVDATEQFSQRIRNRKKKTGVVGIVEFFFLMAVLTQSGLWIDTDVGRFIAQKDLHIRGSFLAQR